MGGLAPALVAVLDIRISQRAAFILEAVSVTIIVILCVAVYVHKGSVVDHAQLTLSGFKPGGVVVGMVLAIFAFVGFESAGALGQEAKNPARSVPHAILWSCGVVGVFYLIVSYAQLYGFGAARFAKATRAAAAACRPCRARLAQPLHRHSASPSACSPARWPASTRARGCC